jgi:hypothetical protein
MNQPPVAFPTGLAATRYDLLRLTSPKVMNTGVCPAGPR